MLYALDEHLPFFRTGDVECIITLRTVSLRPPPEQQERGPEATPLTSCLYVLTALWASVRLGTALKVSEPCGLKNELLRSKLLWPAVAWSTVRRTVPALPTVSGGLRGFTRRLHLSYIAGCHRPVLLFFQKPSLVPAALGRPGRLDFVYKLP